MQNTTTKNANKQRIKLIQKNAQEKQYSKTYNTEVIYIAIYTIQKKIHSH